MISSRGWRVKSTFLRCVGVRTVSGVRACVFCSAFYIPRIKIPVFLGIFFLLRYSTDELKKKKKKRKSILLFCVVLSCVTGPLQCTHVQEMLRGLHVVKLF